MIRQSVDTVAERLEVDAAPQGKPVRPKRSNASRLFGHDIFISFALGPPPRGSHSYASDLARRLRERDFTVFFSEDEAFSPDGSRAVSGSRDGTLRLWDAATGEPVGLPITGHQDEVASIAASLDGRYLLSGGEDNTLRLWPGPTAWPDELCAKLSRNMSRKQWRESVSAEIDYACQCAGLPIAPDDGEPGATIEVCPAQTAR